MEKVTRIMGNTCAHCNGTLDCNRSAANEVPSAGCLAICLYCRKINVFGTDLKLRKPTEQELAAYMANAPVWHSIQQSIAAATRAYEFMEKSRN